MKFLTHEEAIDAICEFTMLTHEETIVLYLRLRGILRDGKGLGKPPAWFNESVYPPVRSTQDPFSLEYMRLF